jgi:hypothetical protein
MDRGFWIAAVVVALGGRATDLAAQDNVWRPVLRPAGSRPAGGLGVQLGRPIPLKSRASLGEDDRVEPSVCREVKLGSPVSQARYQIAGSEPPRGEIIAASGSVHASGRVPAGEEGEPEGEVFASERVQSLPAPLPTAAPKGAPQVAPAANWGEKFPVNGPLPPVPPPPLEGPFGPVRTPSRLYFNGEFLLWWTTRDHTPPLLTTGIPQSANDLFVGTLGRPDTAVLFGGGLNREPQSGARFTAGWWFDECCGKAAEVTGFFLGQRSADFSANSSLNPVLARPFLNLNTNQQFVQLIAFPGISTGSFMAHAPSQFGGVEANYKCRWCCGDCPCCCGCDGHYQVNWLAGLRYVGLDESITLMETVQGGPQAPAPFTNAVGVATDRFATRNQFYGGQVGLEGRWCWGAWSLEGRGKVAVGSTHEEINIDGSQHFTNPSGPVDPRAGGLLALNSNIGHHRQDRFSVVPEAGLNVGYQICANVRAYAGYNFLFWSNVVRPGAQIDPNLDITRIPNFQVPAGTQPVPGAHPGVPFKENTYWAQGLVFGIEFTY